MPGSTNQKRFTPEEDKFIKENFLKKTSKDIAKKLKRTEASINCRLRRLKLKRQEKPEPYSQYEKSFIEENLHLKTDKQIAEELGKTEHAIGSYLFRHKLTKQVDRKGWAKKIIEQNLKNREVHRGKVPDEWFDYPAGFEAGDNIDFKFIFTGNPCVNGHLELRYPNTRKCRGCSRDYSASRIGTPKHLAWRKKWRQKSTAKETINNYQRNKYKSDKQFAVRRNLSSRIAHYLRGKNHTKPEETEKLIGCKWDEFIDYLKSLFSGDMTLDNYGKWQLDHIRPLESFDFEEENQIYVGFNWRNYQPLWKEENRQKSDRYDPDDEIEWEQWMRDLGYEGELFLRFK
jgi:hypothetical protein